MLSFSFVLMSFFLFLNTLFDGFFVSMKLEELSRGVSVSTELAAFAELSKLPIEQGKLDILPCSEKSMIKNAYCESLVNECSKYIPQFIIQPPTSSSEAKNIYSLTSEKKHVSKCSKRKIQNQTDEHFSEPQRKRTKDLDNADLAILECGALAAIANKK